MIRISQFNDESTNSPMYIAVFLFILQELYHKCILCFFCHFSEWEKNLHLSCYLLHCVFFKQKDRKCFISKVVFPAQAYSVLYSFFAMFSRNVSFFRFSMFCYVQLNIKDISSGWIRHSDSCFNLFFILPCRYILALHCCYNNIL